MIGSAHVELAKLGIQNTLQLGFVVEDLSQAVKRHVEMLGIGPWQIYTIEPPELTHMTIHGRLESYGLKAAITQVGNVQWELIQPLQGPSIYREFLKIKPGGGLHHFLVQVEDYDATLRELAKRGVKVLMSGTWRGATFAYADTEKTLGTIVEFYKVEAGWAMSVPEETYP